MLSCATVDVLLFQMNQLMLPALQMMVLGIPEITPSKMCNHASIGMYCRTPLTISCLRRTKIGQGVFKKCAGIRPVDVAGVQDINFTSIVKSSKDWTARMDHVLSVLHLDRHRTG